MAKRLPKEKISLSIYVSPKCKQKLECLQQLYFIAGKRLSLSQIVEETINFIYGTAYFCQDSGLWRSFIRAMNAFETSDATSKGIDEVLSIVQSKPAAAKEILNVPVSLKENAKEAFKEKFSKD